MRRFLQCAMVALIVLSVVPVLAQTTDFGKWGPTQPLVFFQQDGSVALAMCDHPEDCPGTVAIRAGAHIWPQLHRNIVR